MTYEIKLEDIPEIHRNTLAASAAQIIKKFGTSAYVMVPSEKKGWKYILWAGLNELNQLQECYFISNDIVNREILTTH